MTARNPICVSGMAALTWAMPDEIAMYARNGADLIGLQVAKVADFGVAQTAELLARHDVRVGYLVQPISAQPDDDGSWGRESAALAEGVHAAHSLGAGVVYLTSGPSGDLEWEQAADRFAARLAPIVRLAASLGVRIAVENTLPVKSDISFTHTARDAFALADRAGMGVCLDLYCCWQERGLGELILDRIEQVDVVQLSDFRLGTTSFPNRWVPGDADLPLERLLGRVLSAGYTGIVDVELIGPAIEAEGAESALGRAVAWVDAQLASHRSDASFATEMEGRCS